MKDLTSFISELSRSLSSHPTSETLASLNGSLEELRIAEETLHEQATELQKALRRADTERHRYLELFEFAPDAYYVTDKAGVILELNRVASELLQGEPRAIIGKPLFVFINQDHRGDLRSFLSRVIETEAADRSDPSRSLRVWQTEFTITRTQARHISARCTLSSDSMTGPRILWVWRDMTEQKHLQDTLRQMTKTLEQTVENKTEELRQRLEELEAFHDVAVGRELRLMELEKKLKRLESPEDPRSN